MNGTTYAYSFTSDSKSTLTNAPLDGMRLFIETPIDNANITTSFNVVPSLSFGMNDRELVMGGSMVDSDAFSNPYLSLAKNPVTMTISTKMSDDTYVKAGTFFGEQTTDPLAPQTLSEDPNFAATRGRVFGTAAEAGINIGKKSGIAFTAGFVNEEGAMLGSTSSGATKLVDRTTTTFVSASAKFDLGGGLKAFGGFDFGFSDIKGANNSLVTGVDNVTSETFRIGFSKTGVVGKKDTFGFVVSEPLRVNSGSANLSLPTSVDANGQVMMTAANLDIAATGRQMDIQAFYNTEVSKDASFTAGLLLRQNPGHDSSNGTEAVALARYKMAF
jgi:hypothetical protein